MSKPRVRNKTILRRIQEADARHPLYPRCDGKPWEDGRETLPSAAIRRQFLDAYFRINLAYEKLLQLRRKKRSHATKLMERRALQRIEDAIVVRTRLDDKHACRGLVATPAYRDGFTVDVLFSDALTGQKCGHVLIASSSSIRLSFALPVGIP